MIIGWAATYENYLSHYVVHMNHYWIVVNYIAFCGPHHHYLIVVNRIAVKWIAL